MPWKLALAQTIALGWLGVSIWLSLPWVDDLSAAVGVVPAVVVVSLVAYVPGWLVAFLAVRVRRNAAGFVAFVLTYQMLMSPVSVAGYVQELLGLRRRWK